MISNADRSYWIGASDTSYVVGNRNTDSFRKWFYVKLGITESHIDNKYTRAGTHFEHKILATLGDVRKDYQIIIPELRLRVNYDGDKDGVIYEVKTHKADKPFKVTAAYWRQAQVEMFAMKTRELYIVSYGLIEEDYSNYFAEIDESRKAKTKIEYDEAWINNVYLPNLAEIKDCLERGVLPKGARQC